MLSSYHLTHLLIAVNDDVTASLFLQAPTDLPKADISSYARNCPVSISRRRTYTWPTT
jgi:hypothetical protein